MGEIKDRKGNVLIIGDTIRIGDNRYSTTSKIKGFVYVIEQLMIRTDIGDFNLDLVEKSM